MPAAAVRPYDFTAQRINRTQLPFAPKPSTGILPIARPVSLSGLLGRSATLQYDSMEAVKAADLQVSVADAGQHRRGPIETPQRLRFHQCRAALLLTLAGWILRRHRPAECRQPSGDRACGAALHGRDARRLCGPTWTAAWSPVAPLELELVKQETNPRLVQLGKPARIRDRCEIHRGNCGAQRPHRLLLPEALLAPQSRSVVRRDPVPCRRASKRPGADADERLADATARIPARCLPKRRSFARAGDLNAGDSFRSRRRSSHVLAGEVPLYQGRFRHIARAATRSKSFQEFSP